MRCHFHFSALLRPPSKSNCGSLKFNVFYLQSSIFNSIFLFYSAGNLHLFDSRIELKFIELCLVIRITVYGRAVAFRMTEIQSITSLFITCDQVIGLPNHVIR